MGRQTERQSCCSEKATRESLGVKRSWREVLRKIRSAVTRDRSNLLALIEKGSRFLLVLKLKNLWESHVESSAKQHRRSRQTTRLITHIIQARQAAVTVVLLVGVHLLLVQLSSLKFFWRRSSWISKRDSKMNQSSCKRNPFNCRKISSALCNSWWRKSIKNSRLVYCNLTITYLHLHLRSFHVSCLVYSPQVLVGSLWTLQMSNTLFDKHNAAYSWILWTKYILLLDCCYQPSLRIYTCSRRSTSWLQQTPILLQFEL